MLDTQRAPDNWTVQSPLTCSAPLTLCGLVRWISANFGLRSAGIRREASLYLNNGQFYGSRFLVCCQLEKGLIESTSSDTSRFGEIRLALQTELVVKRGIQSVGVDHFQAVMIHFYKHAFKSCGNAQCQKKWREATDWCYGDVNPIDVK